MSKLIASFTTKGNAHWILIFEDNDKTYSYKEFHRERLVAAGTYYPEQFDVFKAVETIIIDSREIDGINYHRVV